MDERQSELGLPTGDETILHVDMDAFFASVEVRDRPELAGKPVIVAGPTNRGVVAAASYEARRYGVHSAMPTFKARRLCPNGVYLSPDGSRYHRESLAIHKIFKAFTPLVEPLSLDEAFLDVSGAKRLFGDAVFVGHAIRARIASERRLVASVGVGTSKLVAKLASRAAKPDGLFCVPSGAEQSFLDPMLLSELWGVGSVTLGRLDKLGVRTVADLVGVPLATLERVLGAQGRYLYAAARAQDDSAVTPLREPRSIGHEQTFPVDLMDADTITTELLRLADRVSRRLRRSGYSARTITVRCRLATFKTFTRSLTVEETVDATPEIHTAACACYGRLRLERPAVRLLGISASGLRQGRPTRQLLFDRTPHWQALMKATDILSDRYGDGTVMPARLLQRDC